MDFGTQPIHERRLKKEPNKTAEAGSFFRLRQKATQAIIQRSFVCAVRLERDRVPDFSKYPFCIPSIRHLDRLEFHPTVTFFVGENGTGKSTLLEAIALRLGYNAEGGGKNFNFHTHATHTHLH